MSFEFRVESLEFGCTAGVARRTGAGNPIPETRNPNPET